jgi:cytosine/adenosine deaminase-related metal-dependent hydrolase
VRQHVILSGGSVLRAAGLAVGAKADLLITRASDVEDLVASGPLERIVLVGGRVVSGHGFVA